MRLFQYAYSNPPYQLDVSKRGLVGVTMEIYPKFQYLANSISMTNTLIYPRNWNKNITVDPAKSFIDNGLKQVSWYNNDENLFPRIHKYYPISITLTEKHYDGGITTINLHNGDTTTNDRNSGIWIEKSLRSLLMKNTESFQKLVDTTTNLVNLGNQEQERVGTFSRNKDIFENPIRIYLKKSAGKQPDAEWTYCDESLLDDHPVARQTIGKYKVVIQSRIFGRVGLWLRNVEAERGSIEAEVLYPNETIGETWTMMKSFDTLVEAENFSRYMNDRVITELVALDYSKRSFGSFVPELGDYTDGNPLFAPDVLLSPDHEFFGRSLTERLLLFFGCSVGDLDVLSRMLLPEVQVNPPKMVLSRGELE